MPKNKILTKRKQAWADRRKPDIIKGLALKYNASIAIRYYEDLAALIEQMAEETHRALVKNFKAPDAQEYFAMDDSVASSSRILTSALQKKFTQLFAAKAKGLAGKMTGANEKATSTSLHKSLEQLSGGLSLGTRVLGEETQEVMKASITENVGLIKSIPSQYFTQIEGAVMRSITTGNGLQTLVPFLKKYKGVTMRRAQFIADDQSRKVYTNLAASRMREIGFTKYIWRHSSSSHNPRQLHLDLDGTIQDLDKPPVIQYAKGSQPQVRGKPGDLINCNCFMQIIVDYSGKT